MSERFIFWEEREKHAEEKKTYSKRKLLRPGEREIYDIEENMDMLVTQLNQDVLNDMRVSLMVLNFFSNGHISIRGKLRVL